MRDASGNLRTLVATVAAAYFSRSPVSASEIQLVIRQVAAGLSAVSADEAGHTASAPATDVSPDLLKVAEHQSPRPMAQATAEAGNAKPSAHQIEQSVSHDALISFEDGRPYRTLRRHLSTRGMTPEQYKNKWGLPGDYPMVAPSYSAARSEMARSLGLGRKPAEPEGRRPGRPRKSVAGQA